MNKDDFGSNKFINDEEVKSKLATAKSLGQVSAAESVNLLVLSSPFTNLGIAMMPCSTLEGTSYILSATLPSSV